MKEEKLQKEKVATKKKTASNAVIILLLAVIVVSAVIGMYAWAKYTSSANGEAQAQVAKWHFDIQGDKTETGDETLLAFTRTDGYTKVAENKVAPGTFGELPITIDTTGTEVDLTYDLTVTITNFPKNMTLKDSSSKVIIPEVTGEGTETSPRIATINISKYVSCNTEDSNRMHDETIKWEWLYETGTGNNLVENDKIDTKDAGKEIAVNVSVTGTEVFGSPKVYGKLYTDGTLILSGTDYKAPDKTVEVDYGEISSNIYSQSSSLIGNSDRSNVTKVEIKDRILPTNTAYWFYGCSNLTEIEGIENLDTRNVTDMTEMFVGCSGLTSLDISGLNAGNVTDMSYMFACCSGLTSLDISGLDARNVTDMTGTFFGCSGLTSLDISGLDARNVTDMSEMFHGCSGLTSIDMSKWNTGSIVKMNCMFYECSGLTSVDMSDCDTRNVTNMFSVFYGCSELTSIDLSGWNTENVTSTSAMFANCNGLKTIYVSEAFKVDNVTDSGGMFYGCTSLVGGAGTPYNSEHFDKEYARIDSGSATPWYFTKKTD